jgi:catechol 2,3-dioxygenase-like lactoylglutathione lyase family enzyme
MVSDVTDWGGLAMSIAVVSVPVSDQAAAKAFYTDKLLFDVMRDEAMGPDMRWIQLQPKDGGSSIALTTWFENLKPGGQTGLMNHVPDIDAEYQRLVGVGVEASPIDEQPWGRFTMFTDLDGNGWIFATLTSPESFRAK